MAHDVFICHSSKDKRTAVKVCKFLEGEDIKCWIAPRDVPSAIQYPDAIIDAIENCKIVVVIFSSDSNKSEYVKREIINAAGEEKYIFVIRVQDEPLRGGLKLYLRGLQWVDAFEGPIENYKDKIVSDIREKLDNPGKDVSTEKKSKARSVARPKWDIYKLNTAFFKSKFNALDRFDPKTPLEMIKQSPVGDKVLPVMAELAKKGSIDEQIQYAKDQRYTDIYTDSWAEHESQIIGLHVLSRLFSLDSSFVLESMYDAGCANCGQYNALRAFVEREELMLSKSFTYFAQDFNPDWEDKFIIKKGKFFLETLPQTHSSMKGRCDLVSCTHALHYLGNNPLAIYSSFFSFNRLLRPNGYCYITVPEKASLPGILDVLEKSAGDAGFIVKESGKSRLIHALTQEPHNITTFFYLIIQKTKPVEEKVWKQLIGASFFELKDFKIAGSYGIDNYSDITREIKKLDNELKGMMTEKDTQVRLFRYVLDRVRSEGNGNIPDVRLCNENIQHYIYKIHGLITKSDNQTSDMARYDLQAACASYFYWLVAFFISMNHNDNDDDRENIKILKDIIYNNKDIRVDINNLNEEQVARLIKHLFELCQHERIDILRAFEDLDRPGLLKS